jgi:glycerol uptake facilitator-like aquaporin
MEPNHYIALDFGGYLYGMFLTGALMMGAYGIYAALNSTKGILPPLAITCLIAGYLWWSGDLDGYLPNLAWR